MDMRLMHIDQVTWQRNLPGKCGDGRLLVRDPESDCAAF
jgi:hypothetical protein